MTTQILKPALTTTRLAYNKTGWYASTVDEVVGGSLADIGRSIGPQIYGSRLHLVTGLILAPLMLNRALLHHVSSMDGVSEEDLFMKM